MNDPITIKFWVDSKANIHSRHDSTFEVDRADWEAMSENEKWKLAEEEAWNQDMLEIGFEEPEND